MLRRSQGCYNTRVLTSFSFRPYSQRPNSKEDALRVLGLETNATKQEIKDAFLKLSKILHPDVNKKSNAAEEFQRIKTAFDSLLKGFSNNIQQSKSHENEQASSRMSEEFRNFKRRQDRTREMDEYLKRIRRENFKRKNVHQEDEDRYSNFSRKNVHQEDEDRYSNFSKDEKDWFTANSQKEWKPPHLDKHYIEYEKTFIHYLEYLLFFGRVPGNDTRTIPAHSAYLLRGLVKMTSIVVIIVFLASGVEIYHEMHQDEPVEVRPEYVESMKQKSGTLDDL